MPTITVRFVDRNFCYIHSFPNFAVCRCTPGMTLSNRNEIRACRWYKVDEWMICYPIQWCDSASMGSWFCGWSWSSFWMIPQAFFWPQRNASALLPIAPVHSSYFHPFPIFQNVIFCSSLWVTRFCLYPNLYFKWLRSYAPCSVNGPTIQSDWGPYAPIIFLEL